jgi:DNA-binding transcriptional LysR family regulator
MDLDFKQLIYMLTIARNGSFSRAAQLLNMSQPALSNSIAQLERKVGSRVLTRGRSGAALTETGKMLARHAELLEIQMTRAAEELRHHRLSVAGPLVVGTTPVATNELVPRALARLKQEAPNAAVLVEEIVFNLAMRALLNGEIDLMVGPIGVYPPVEGVAEERLAMDPFTLVVPPGHKLARRRTISLRHLREVQWVLPSEQSTYRRQLEALFVTAGLPWPVDAICTNSMTALRSIVIHGNGVALMPKQLVALEQRAGLLRCIPLREAGATRALGVSRAKNRTVAPLAARFVQLLRECARTAHL